MSTQTLRDPSQTGTSSNKKNWLWGAAGACALTAGYFIYKWQKKKNAALTAGEIQQISYNPMPAVNTTNTPVSTPVVNHTEPKKSTATTAKSPVQTSASFPLQKGSKGKEVKQLQEILIKKKLLAAGTADGIFGSKTEAALYSLTNAKTISSTEFALLVNDDKRTMTEVGTSLYSIAASLTPNIDQAISKLKLIGNTDQYTVASTAFKANPLGLVRMTLVTGMLRTFTDAEQQLRITKELERIGLQLVDDKWQIPQTNSMAGYCRPQIITIQPAIIYLDSRRQILVPARTILGLERTRRHGYTAFEIDGRECMVQSSLVSYL